MNTEQFASLADHFDRNDPDHIWVFTFGYGQNHYGKYVRIQGTWSEARAEMAKRYGIKWSTQYYNEQMAGVKEFSLEELVEP